MTVAIIVGSCVLYIIIAGVFYRLNSMYYDSPYDLPNFLFPYRAEPTFNGAEVVAGAVFWPVIIIMMLGHF